MLWPSSDISITKIYEIYLKLVLLLKDYNESFFQKIRRTRIDLLFLKSLVKRWIYFKSEDKDGIIRNDSKILLTNFITQPRILFYFFLSRFIAYCFSLKNLIK